MFPLKILARKGLSPVARNLFWQWVTENRSGVAEVFPWGDSPKLIPEAWQYKCLVRGINPDYNMVSLHI